MVFKRVFTVTSLIIMLLSAGFLTGYLVRDILAAGDSKFPILVEAYDILQKNGINEIPPATRMEYGMIHGMVQAYDDPYTIFVEPIQHELESNNLQGSFGGIGVALERDSIGQVVLNPFPGSPALEAGVLEGDILLTVNNEALNPDISINTITAWLRGPVGEKVEIVLSRGDAGTQYEFAISRVEFPLPSVTWHLDFEEPDIGLIDINIVAASTKDELIKAVEDLKSRGASAFILDLRDNSGGLLTAGIDISRLFLEKGVVIEQQYRNKSVETYYIEKPGPYIDFPLVVLINQNTASAAEIIAGAVKRQGRAVVVGSPSMGKDSIQLVFELEDGSSLHVTAAKWWIPGLQPFLNEVGLQPDVAIAANDPLSEYDLAIAEARKILRQQLAP